MQITPRVRSKQRDGRQTAALFDPPKYPSEHQEQRGNVELVKRRSLAGDVRNMENGGNAVKGKELGARIWELGDFDGARLQNAVGTSSRSSGLGETAKTVTCVSNCHEVAKQNSPGL